MELVIAEQRSSNQTNRAPVPECVLDRSELLLTEAGSTHRIEKLTHVALVGVDEAKALLRLHGSGTVMMTISHPVYLFLF